MKLGYKQRLFLYFALIFGVFTIGIILFEQFQEKKVKTEALEEKLDIYTEVVQAYLLNQKDARSNSLDGILPLLPPNLRLSLIDKQGVVLFDNSIKNVEGLENHKNRPEILDALKDGTGTEIRTSTSNQQAYLYYVKDFGHQYIRVALPYDLQTRKFLQADNLFLYFIIALFGLMLLLVNFITSRFGNSINQLRDFALSADSNGLVDYDFPNDELGEIGTSITKSYKKLKESQNQIALEREKLLQHIHTSEEGICFVSADKKIEFYNGLFIQYLNTLTEEPSSDFSSLFSEEIFQEMNLFLSEKKANYFETQLSKQGKVFSLRVNVFEDKGFEIILNDITKHEKTRRLKQEMTSNIAHELRTPLTSIRGYLETAMVPTVDEEKKNHFVKQAHDQTLLLSEIIQDMGMITKIEEAPLSFKRKDVAFQSLFESLKEDFSDLLKEKNIELNWTIPADLTLKANRNLMYSIFRNLIDNSIRYGGESIQIQINMYKEDKDFYYFSFFDTGAGISDESYLNRLFERFYRINEGRTRDTGGTGLGLSIVKNAIGFHKGTIVARNRNEGGLEFLFQLHK
ncbi:MAG: ATP-binding protein [Weeksellaceae bacterium]